MVRCKHVVCLECEDAEVVELRKRLEYYKNACFRMNEEISQILGEALRYPRFCDDQKNFPNSTVADGVCVGDHTAVSLAEEAAIKLRNLR